MRPPLRVLLDVNILGRGYGAEATRTGIFRSTEHLVRALNRRNDLELCFAAESSWVSELQFLTYARDRGVQLQGKVLRAWSHPGIDEAEGFILIERIIATEAAGGDARRDRASLMLLNATARRTPVPDRFDILHSLRTALVPGSRLAARARVLTVHDVIPLLYPEWMYQGAEAEVRAIMDSVNPAADFIIANSAATARDVATTIPLPGDRMFVTPFAASTELFFPEASPERLRQVRERYGIPDGPYLLSLGTLEPRKNLPLLMEAYSGLLARGELPGVALVLVGPVGWKAEPVFATLAARPELAGRVHHTGFVADEDLAAIYSGARAFVYASLYEGFGLPVLEAMQCGTPVITSNVSSLPEVGGDAVEYVGPEDRTALAGALLRLATDDARAAELRRKGLERARTFSWDRTAEGTAAAYREISSRSA